MTNSPKKSKEIKMKIDTKGGEKSTPLTGQAAKANQDARDGKCGEWTDAAEVARMLAEMGEDDADFDLGRDA
jgi:hypothetical protein